ncbi:MAG: disulfide bond formation protein B [Chromatiales bacterium]|nr:disulfide bond formation protein B [Chromatiales bacterium]
MHGLEALPALHPAARGGASARAYCSCWPWPHDPGGSRRARLRRADRPASRSPASCIAARHIWIMAQPPGAVAECGASLDYMMDVLPLHEVLGKVLTGSGECAKLDWQFLGLNMPTWVLMALVGVGTWGLAVNWFGRRGR